MAQFPSLNDKQLKTLCAALHNKARKLDDAVEAEGLRRLADKLWEKALQVKYPTKNLENNTPCTSILH
jgi:hypothetical protein